MLDGRVLEASQVEYEPFGKPPLQRESSSFTAGRVSRIWKLTFARKGSRIASRSWSRSTSSRMASMVKTCCPGRGRSRSSRVQAAPRGRSSVTAASALGARGSSRGTARTAARPRRPQMR